MRNNGTALAPECAILAFYLDSSLPDGQSFVLGDGFFQNFAAFLTYGDNTGASNTVDLAVSSWALAGNSIGTKTYPLGDNPFPAIPDPTPSPNPNPPGPTPEPTPSN
jgi:hypothetical protein